MYLESVERIAKIEGGTGVKVEKKKVGNSINASFLKMISESMSWKMFVCDGLGLKLPNDLDMIWTVTASPKILVVPIWSISAWSIFAKYPKDKG